MKFLLKIFILIFVFSATELHEILKFPILFQHYSEHKQSNNKITFFSFLKDHYLNHKGKDANDSKDMKLPFKSDDKNLITSSYLFFQFNTENKFFVPLKENSEPNLLYQKLELKEFNSNIWQPPKI